MVAMQLYSVIGKNRKTSIEGQLYHSGMVAGLSVAFFSVSTMMVEAGPSGVVRREKLWLTVPKESSSG